MAYSGGSDWSQWLTELAQAPAEALDALVRSDYSFPSAQGLIIVREEQRPVAYRSGTTAKARCVSSGQEYDLRRLSAGSQAGGLVALAELQALEREAKLMIEAGRHLHVLQCYGTLIENVGMTHCRLLLCESSDGDLSARLKNHEGGLPAKDVADIGQQLAFGLFYLHSLQILCGSLMPQSVVLGRDGMWKLADFSHSTQLPISLAEWREQCSGVQVRESADRTPPETRGNGTTMLQPEMDVWLLGYFLAVLLFNGSANGNISTGVEKDSVVLAIAPASLLEPSLAKLWLLLHWLLARQPTERPKANEVAALASTVFDASPCELLHEMPSYVSLHCTSAAMAAARQLAMDDTLALVANATEHDRLIHRLTNLQLGKLCEKLIDPSCIHQLCKNCGLESENKLGVTKRVCKDRDSEFDREFSESKH